MSRPPPSRAQRVRYTLYAAATTVAALLVIDAVVRLVERGGHDLGNEGEQVWLMPSSPWERDGEWYVTTVAALKSMSPSRFLADKGSAWRTFLVGGSFLRGVPYDDEGTIAWWLRSELEARFPDRRFEVVNAGASAQNSSRVRQIASYALEHGPDALIVATCNNEGTLPPSRVTERLHSLGTFRLFRSLLRDGEAPADRPRFTPQDPDVDAVREAFRDNLRAIADAASSRGFPVLLCTLPVNLRYAGEEPGLPLAGHAWEAPGTVTAPDCVARGVAALRRGALDEAEATLRACDQADALRWLGLVHYERGEHHAARRLLSQSVELLPRNRCRPSFNAVIREEAARSPLVHLVDLERLIREDAPHGIPGDEHFTDYCHLRWPAQRQVAEALYRALEEAMLTPAGEAAPDGFTPPPDLETRLAR